MKVTAILPDELIASVRTLTRGRNITDALKIALDDWVKMQQLQALNLRVSEKPLAFRYNAENIRNTNRKP
jgi:hypothetical protein